MQERAIHWGTGLETAIRDAMLISIVAGSLGIAVNLVHPERIPFIAATGYEVLVPCPEPGGEVVALLPDDPVLLNEATLLVDARAQAEHARWRFGEAMNVPYDYLDPTPDEVIEDLARRIARSRARRVVVYGDGDTPDTGEQLGKEVSAAGIKNVCFVRGGAPALEKAQEQGAGS